MRTASRTRRRASERGTSRSRRQGSVARSTISSLRRSTSASTAASTARGTGRGGRMAIASMRDRMRDDPPRLGIADRRRPAHADASRDPPGAFRTSEAQAQFSLDCGGRSYRFCMFPRCTNIQKLWLRPQHSKRSLEDRLSREPPLTLTRCPTYVGRGGLSCASLWRVMRRTCVKRVPSPHRSLIAVGERVRREGPLSTTNPTSAARLPAPAGPRSTTGTGPREARSPSAKPVEMVMPKVETGRPAGKKPEIAFTSAMPPSPDRWPRRPPRA